MSKKEIKGAEGGASSAAMGNSVTLNCSFDLQSLSPSYGGQNIFNVVIVSYATLRSALASHATSADDLVAVAALNNLADSSGSRGCEIPVEQARMGFAGPGSGINDAVVLKPEAEAPAPIRMLTWAGVELLHERGDCLHGGSDFGDCHPGLA